MKKITPKQYKFEIVSEGFDDNLKEIKVVKLDGKVIYRINSEKYMGHMVEQTAAVLDALSKATKKTITKKQLDRAMTLNLLIIE